MSTSHLKLIPIQLKSESQKLQYPSPDCQSLFSMWDAFYPIIGYHEPWIGYLVEQNGIPVGASGFNGPPKNGEVEISYWTFKEYESQGIASIVCRIMAELALKTDPTLEVFAKTAPQENASTTVLRKNGFVFAGLTEDHEIGTAWKWKFIDSAK